MMENSNLMYIVRQGDVKVPRSAPERISCGMQEKMQLYPVKKEKYYPLKAQNSTEDPL